MKYNDRPAGSTWWWEKPSQLASRGGCVRTFSASPGTAAPRATHEDGFAGSLRFAGTIRTTACRTIRIDIVIALAEFAVALGILMLGAELLVRGASMLAVRAGVSPLAVGLTIVAFGTSTPELIVSMDAALQGSSDIALGNVVGSNICNVALVLGLSALVRPLAVHARIFRIDAPVLLLASCVLAVVLYATGGVTRTLGVIFLLGLTAYTVHALRQAKREPAPVIATVAETLPSQPANLARSAVFVLLGLSALALGGSLLVGSAIALANRFTVSEAVIGLTIVAVGTSLPELATSVVAAARGKGDIAVGNVVGSNIFNILGIIGVSALAQPLTLGSIDWVSVCSMLVTALVLLPIARTGFVVSRVEGGLLLLLYVGYTAWLLIA